MLYFRKIHLKLILLFCAKREREFLVNKRFNLLVVVNDRNVLKDLNKAFERNLYRLWQAESGKEAISFIKKVHFVAVISELELEDINGLKLTIEAKRLYSQINVILLTDISSINKAVEALKKGAYAYLLKPLNLDEVKLVVKRAIENTYLYQQARKKDYYQNISALDGLTGVYNHRHFNKVLDWHMKYSRRKPKVLSLFMIDLDDFKQFNDREGHVEGDKLLYETAQLFVKSIRDRDMVFRYGGDEFTIIMLQTPKSKAKKVGERLLTEVRKNLPITVSIGLATYPEDADTKYDLVVKADEALYKAKRKNKDRLCSYTKRISKERSLKEERKI